jgi:hypothetical protein
MQCFRGLMKAATTYCTYTASDNLSSLWFLLVYTQSYRNVTLLSVRCFVVFFDVCFNYFTTIKTPFISDNTIEESVKYVLCMIVFWSVHPLKMEKVCHSETFLYSQITTQRNNPEDRNLYSYYCKNLKSYNIFYIHRMLRSKVYGIETRLRKGTPLRLFYVFSSFHNKLVCCCR